VCLHLLQTGESKSNQFGYRRVRRIPAAHESRRAFSESCSGLLLQTPAGEGKVGNNSSHQTFIGPCALQVTRDG
jgi:hypothetical protein